MSETVLGFLMATAPVLLFAVLMFALWVTNSRRDRWAAEAEAKATTVPPLTPGLRRTNLIASAAFVGLWLLLLSSVNWSHQRGVGALNEIGWGANTVLLPSSRVAALLAAAMLTAVTVTAGVVLRGRVAGSLRLYVILPVLLFGTMLGAAIHSA
jgi:hypothetical protein